MRHIIFVAATFFFSNSNSQSTIEKEDLIGCWEFVDYADSTTLNELGMGEIFEHDIRLININSYKTATREGDWELIGGMLVTYKSQFTESEREMAEYFKKSPREATKIVYPDLKLKGGFLYYLIYSEAAPFVMYAKLKKVDCHESGFKDY